MFDLVTWALDKLRPKPSITALRGLSRRDMERKLRNEFGFSTREAKRFVFENKAQIRTD
jgi:hypothetical protein